MEGTTGGAGKGPLEPETPTAPVHFRVPGIIKRNMTLFALSQAFTGAGMSFAYGFGPLMVVGLTGSAALAGLTVALLGFSRFLVAYPVGKITDTYGRKPGIMLGLVLALVGAIGMGLSMIVSSIFVLIAAMLVFGMGMNAAQQLRVAATDMYLPNNRAQALGYISLGSLAGLLLVPAMMTSGEQMAKWLGQHPLALPWFLMVGIIVFGMVLVYFVRPDPKVIGMNLQHYYPGYEPPKRKVVLAAAFRPIELLQQPRTRLAIVSNCAGQGNMAIVMVLTSLVLSHHGHTLPEIAFSHMFHSMGMFGFTVPFGRLSDRFGHYKVMLPGVAVAFAGAALVTFTYSYFLITLGTFLVGLGWAAANVAATALIADKYETQERGRAIGVNESFAGGMAMAASIATGPLIEWGGLPAAGVCAILIALPPLLMFVGQVLTGVARAQPER
ncbi:MAG: MFS transporter [Hyphomicrobiaceae bacterium]